MTRDDITALAYLSVLYGWLALLGVQAARHFLGYA